MRYCMTLYLKGYQKCDKSKLKVQVLSMNSGVSTLTFQYILRYRVMQYLITNLLVVVKIETRELVVAAFLISVSLP